MELFASWGEGCQLALNSGLLGTMVEPLPRTWKQGDRMSNGFQRCFRISIVLEISFYKRKVNLRQSCLGLVPKTENAGLDSRTTSLHLP